MWKLQVRSSRPCQALSFGTASPQPGPARSAEPLAEPRQQQREHRDERDLGGCRAVRTEHVYAADAARVSCPEKGTEKKKKKEKKCFFRFAAVFATPPTYGKDCVRCVSSLILAASAPAALESANYCSGSSLSLAAGQSYASAPLHRPCTPCTHAVYTTPCTEVPSACSGAGSRPICLAVRSTDWRSYFPTHFFFASFSVESCCCCCRSGRRKTWRPADRHGRHANNTISQ